MAELQKYAVGPFGEEDFGSYMAEMCCRVRDGTTQIDIDREDIDRLELHRSEGHNEAIDRVFTRAIKVMLTQLLG
jgi:hypothetical protein